MNSRKALGLGKVSTNDLYFFLAKPVTNTFDITLAEFEGERFHLQIQHGRIQLFKDMANNVEGLTENEQKIKEVMALTNSLDAKAAVQVAREALHRIGFDEKQLQLREPPTVRQIRVPSGAGRPLTLPLYDVFWLFPEADRPKYGENATAVGFQISGITKSVVMFANNSPLTPKLPFPTNSPAPLTDAQRLK